MENREITTRHYNNLIDIIGEILKEARTQVVREINKAQVLAYWEIGKEIVEFEQKGKVRTEYGKKLIVRLAKDMTQKFGKGFIFVARQMRITINNRHHYIDLVFYNRLLKCLVLIDLKTGELNHADIGQIYPVKYSKENCHALCLCYA